MARLRIRLRFNPGRTGTPLDKFADFASQSEKFLRSLAADLGVKVRKGEWLALKFGNESVSWDNEYAESVDATIKAKGLRAITGLTSDEPLAVCNQGLISYGTVAEFSRLGKAMDPDENFFIGMYEDDSSIEPQWKEVSYRKVSEIRQLLDSPLVSYGSVQGVMYAWHSGADPHFFNMRELSTGNLIKCVYRSIDHSHVHEAFEKPNTVVHVHGDIEWDRGTNSVLEVKTNKIQITKSLSDFEFESIFGSMPEFTSGLSTSEYISWLRDDGE